MLIAVTGGNGFIGSAVVENLIGAGHKVRIIDLTGNPGQYHRGELSRSQYHRVDVRSPELEKHLAGCDHIVHLAAYSKILECIKNPEMAWDINVGGVLNVLLAARTCKVRRVVFASSASVYGNQLVPFREDCPARPLNPYGLTKLWGEGLCRTFTHEFGLATVSLRLFNVYGSENGCPSVVELFLCQRKLGQKLTVIGDGRQRRDLIHVSDVAAAFAAAIASPLVGRGEIINIGLGTSHSVLDIAGWVGGEIIHTEERYVEAQETLADIALAKEFLNWQPVMNLQNWIANKIKSETR